MKEVKSFFEEAEKKRYLSLLGTKYVNFDTACGNYILTDKKKGEIIVHPSFVLKDGFNNLYPQIEEEALIFFFVNKIKWWSLERCFEDGAKPPTHVLSSQVCCINHLFPLRKDPNAVLAIAKAVDPAFTEVYRLDNDKDETQGYISFEVVSKDDHLNEESKRRGEYCTSVDALILGKRNGKKTMIVIEWKYTETYKCEDYSKEDNPFRAKGNMEKGNTRLKRYSDLIRNSAQLEHLEGKDLRGSIYFFEPFYQLMRQTLWAEQMIRHSATETIKADDYIHIHVVPSGNKALLDKIYPCSGKGMEETWRSVINDQSKYEIIDPKDLFSSIDSKKYEKLIDYLSNRYWKE